MSLHILLDLWFQNYVILNFFQLYKLIMKFRGFLLYEVCMYDGYEKKTF